MRITRTLTDRGQIVRFDNSAPIAAVDEEWPHKGKLPTLSISQRGAHVLLLVDKLNAWFESPNKVSAGVFK